MENKIHLKDVFGTSHLQKSDRAPNHKPHYMSKGLRQEENLKTLMESKDANHNELKFKSEYDPLDPNNKRKISLKVN